MVKLVGELFAASLFRNVFRVPLMIRLLLPALVAICFGSAITAAQEVAKQDANKNGPAAAAQPATQAAAQPAAQPSPAESQFPPEAHPWGRFPVGSWKVVRVTAETVDALGHVVNTTVTETKTTLIEANDLEYKLKVESSVQIGGKRFPHPPQVTRLSYWGELTASPAGVLKVSASELDLNGKKIACEVRQAVIEREGERRQTVVHYASNQFPYLLKRESSVNPAEGKPTTTTVEVLASNMPQHILGVLRPVAYVRTNHHTAKNSAVTIEVQSAEIPGGVALHSAQERDAAGAVTRRTALELVEYGVGSESPEEASPGRRRWFRSRNRRGDDPNTPRRER